MRARRVAGIGACRRQFARDFADVFRRKIGVIEHDRPVDQANRDLGSAARTRHQGREPYQIQTIGVSAFLAGERG